MNPPEIFPALRTYSPRSNSKLCGLRLLEAPTIIALCALCILTSVGQTQTNLATIVTVGGGRASGGNVVVETTLGGVSGASSAPANVQVQHGFIPQMRPAPPALLGPMLAGGVNLTAFGEDGVSYTLQTSPDLSAWSGAGPVRTTNGVVRLTRALPTGATRFYRIAAAE